MSAGEVLQDPGKVHEVVIVGCGMTGAWAAKVLAEAGLQVLVLDAGPMPDPSAGAPEPARSRKLAPPRQRIQCQHPAYWDFDPDFFVDDIENPYDGGEENAFIWIRGRQVGGRSLTWGGVTLRFSDLEFQPTDDAESPPRWPLSYEQLAPFYEIVERYWGVRGACDGLAQLPDGHYREPPELTSLERQFTTLVQDRWPDRRVIHCRGVCPNQVDGNDTAAPCWAPRTVLHRVLPDALRTGRVTLLPNSIVSHLVPAEHSSRVDSVICIDRHTREMRKIRARVVVLCASAYESVRILLNSRTERFPAGIGNSSGVLGRYLTDHASVSLAGLTAPGPARPRGGPHGVLVPRFCNLRKRDSPFVGGYGIWGSFQRGTLGARALGAWSLSAMLEVLPQFHNRIDLDESACDAWGVPMARIHFTYGDNERAMQAAAEAWMREAIAGLGLRIGMRAETAPGGFVHELGGARMGDDSKSSVLNANNQCWDVRNLFVLDGSAFVSSGWQNPALTMVALALRACRHIHRELASGAL